jgi:copper transport protein
VRRLTGLLLAALVAVALALVPATPALAHAALLASDPQDGVVLDTAPEQVVLTFNQPVGIGLGAVRVVGPDGERVDGGAPELRDGGRRVVAALPRAEQRGTYVLLWRVMSEDSHPVSGASTFSIGAPSEPATAAQADDAGTTPALRAFRLVGYLGVLLLVGAVVVPLVAWPAGLALRSVRGLQATGWALALLGSTGTLLAQGPNAAGLPLSRALELLPEVLTTRYGTAHLARLALLGVLGAVLVVLARRGSAGRPVGLLLAAVGLPLLATWSLAGHPAAGDLRWLAVPADALHLLAVGTWAGGLVVLVVALLRRTDADELRSGLTAWSRLATAAVVAMVLTGLFAGWREVRGVDALGATDYGRLLLLKSVLVLAMLYAGNRGRSLVRRSFDGRTVVHAATAQAVDAVAPPTPSRPDARRALRRGALAEACLAAVVVLVTTVLVDTPPAASAYVRPLSTVVQADDDLTVQLDLDSARVGPNTLHVYLTTTGGRALDVPEVTARITRDGESVPVAVRRESLGHYEATERLVVPYAGTWVLEVVIRTSDIESDTVRQQLTIR